jgi:peptidoglycan hydrolase CwlO-like protein
MKESAKVDHTEFYNYYSTKDDVTGAKAELQKEISNIKAELKQDISNFRNELKEDIHALDRKIDSVDRKIDSVKSEIKDMIYNQSNKMLSWVIGLALIPILLQIFGKKLGL